jgi:hypothetical protein
MIEIPKIAKVNDDGNLKISQQTNADSKTRKKASNLQGMFSFSFLFVLQCMNSHVQGLVAKAFAKFEVLQLNCSIVTLHSRFLF